MVRARADIDFFSSRSLVLSRSDEEREREREISVTSLSISDFIRMNHEHRPMTSTSSTTSSQPKTTLCLEIDRSLSSLQVEFSPMFLVKSVTITPRENIMESSPVMGKSTRHGGPLLDLLSLFY